MQRSATVTERIRTTVCAPSADPAYERLREELMRVGLMAVSERQDGCINKTTALRIREIVYRACWPDERLISRGIAAPGVPGTPTQSGGLPEGNDGDTGAA